MERDEKTAVPSHIRLKAKLILLGRALRRFDVEDLAFVKSQNELLAFFYEGLLWSSVKTGAMIERVLAEYKEGGAISLEGTREALREFEMEEVEDGS